MTMKEILRGDKKILNFSTLLTSEIMRYEMFTIAAVLFVLDPKLTEHH